MAAKAVDPLFAAYARTAPRLDLEFTIAHRWAPLPLDLAQRFAAEHAACVRDEPTGRNHGKHAKAVAALTAEYRRYVCARLSPAVYHAPLFTRDEYAALDCIKYAERAYAAACWLSADLAAFHTECSTVARATKAYAALAGQYNPLRYSLADWDQIAEKVAA